MSARDQYEAFFREADTDGSGELSLDELRVILVKKGYKYPDQELRSMFASVDTSGDGKISMEEYLVAMGMQPPRSHGLAAMRRVFLEFDRDGNGRIDKNELKSTFKELGKYFSEEEVNAMIRTADQDGSGDMDYREFVKSVFGVDI